MQQTATREVLANREELGRIVEARRLALRWSVAQVANSLGVAGETIRAFEQGRGHLGVPRVHQLLDLLGIQDARVETRPAKPGGYIIGTPRTRQNYRQLQMLLAFVIHVRGQMTPGMAASCMDVTTNQIKQLARCEWFFVGERNISLTQAGREAIG